MSLSDLSFGDKMSLKGKLFELQKKLNLIGIQKEMEEDPEATFQPTFEARQFNLRDRHKNFHTNVMKSETIRKQKLDMMRQTLHTEHTQEYTFEPKIHTKPKSQLKEKRILNKSICELREQGREGELPADRRARRIKEDEDARKAMASRKYTNPGTEKILKKRQQALESSEESTFSRAGRHSRENVAKQVEQETTQTKKISSKSESILDSKFRKEIFMLFSHLDEEQSGTICFDDIRHAVVSNVVSTHNDASTVESAGIIWTLLDTENKGYVSFPEFLKSCQVCRAEKGRAVKDNKSVFRDFVLTMVQKLKNDLKGPKIPETIQDITYQPRIADLSTKLNKKVWKASNSSLNLASYKMLHLYPHHTQVRAKEEAIFEKLMLASQSLSGSLIHEDESCEEESTVLTSSTKLTSYDHMMIRRKLALDRVNERRKVI